MAASTGETFAIRGKPPDFFLGRRTEGLSPTDFDGVVRACLRLGRLKYLDMPRGDKGGIWVAIGPPLEVSPGRLVSEVVLRERYKVDDIDNLGNGCISVFVSAIPGKKPFPSDLIKSTDLLGFSYGDVAAMPSLLPRTPEERFEEGLAATRRFASTHGHTDVPATYEENGYKLGNWVENMRVSRANTGLLPHWERRLGELPGWRWLPGNDFCLLERYARLNGHTDLRADHFEEGRPLGAWVQWLRQGHATSSLSQEWEQRLESIPHWRW